MTSQHSARNTQSSECQLLVAFDVPSTQYRTRPSREWPAPEQGLKSRSDADVSFLPLFDPASRLKRCQAGSNLRKGSRNKGPPQTTGAHTDEPLPVGEPETHPQREISHTHVYRGQNRIYNVKLKPAVLPRVRHRSTHTQLPPSTPVAVAISGRSTDPPTRAARNGTKWGINTRHGRKKKKRV